MERTISQKEIQRILGVTRTSIAHRARSQTMKSCLMEKMVRLAAMVKMRHHQSVAVI
jgi:predicted XRE-type DNA-binding protein